MAGYRRPLEEREYALYKLDDFVMIGSMQEIIDYTGITRNSFKSYRHESHIERSYQRSYTNDKVSTWIIVDFDLLDHLEEIEKKKEKVLQKQEEMRAKRLLKKQEREAKAKKENISK